MVKFINGQTGSVMWVHESRVGEYLAAGHKLAGSISLSAPEKKPTRKKTTK